MSSIVPVAVHRSQFPDQVRRDLLESLRRRQINHKFHYDSFKQSRKWLALHAACSPASTGDVAAMYDQSFQTVGSELGPARVHVIGLGCGGGQKDAALLRRLRAAGKELQYTAVDVSVALVLTARQAVQAIVPEADCSALVCDLGTALDLPEVLDRWPAKSAEEIPLTPTSLPKGEGNLRRAEQVQRFDTASSVRGSARLFTFFGMLPNFEPDVILPRLAALIGPGDELLLSANLAPGQDYAAGVRQILPQYDNELTRDWLMTLLLDLGLEKTDGEIQFRIEDVPARGAQLKRVAADFRFARRCALSLDQQRFEFAAGESLGLFFSYRHTPDRVRALMREHGLGVAAQWLAESQQEGVFQIRPQD